MKFLNKSQQFNKIIGSPAKWAMRVGKKEGGLGEGIFARLFFGTDFFRTAAVLKNKREEESPLPQPSRARATTRNSFDDFC